jgi:hypothetical protein
MWLAKPRSIFRVAHRLKKKYRITTAATTGKAFTSETVMPNNASPQIPSCRCRVDTNLYHSFSFSLFLDVGLSLSWPHLHLTQQCRNRSSTLDRYQGRQSPFHSLLTHYVGEAAGAFRELLSRERCIWPSIRVLRSLDKSRRVSREPSHFPIGYTGVRSRTSGKVT